MQVFGNDVTEQAGTDFLVFLPFEDETKSNYPSVVFDTVGLLNVFPLFRIRGVLSPLLSQTAHQLA